MSSPVDAVPIRPAASVLLLRTADDFGLEVFTITRAATMAFAAGVVAFPGGGVDPTDAEPVSDWTGPDAPWWSAALGSPTGGELVVAAVRELFEEVGVLLAGGASGQLVRAAGELAAARDELAAHRTSLSSLLASHRLSLRSDLLRPWARWITPPGQTRRYDTYFFTAALPDGQQARLTTTEAESGTWSRPADLLEAYRAGRLMMLPPTVVVLTELTEHADLPSALAAPRRIRPVEPEVVSAPGEPVRIRVNGVEIDLMGRLHR